MALYKEQLKVSGVFQRNPGKGRRWVKNQRNRWIRRQSKNTKNHLFVNRYFGYAD